jgi:NADH:ubiquinone oxidoreductase subunit C
MRFSSIFYSNQLVDIFSYELPMNNGFMDITDKPIYTSNAITVYNFHNLTSQERFFIFCTELTNDSHSFNLNSIADLFPNAN